MSKYKKIPIKNLKKPDEFTTFTEKVFLFFKHNYQSLVMGGVILLILIGGWLFYQRWENKNDAEARKSFNRAMEAYQIVNSPYSRETLQEYSSVLEMFDEVAKRYPNTVSGRVSILYKGNIHLYMREFDKAIQSYEAFLDKSGMGSYYPLTALEGLGYAYEGKEEYKEALSTFKKIIAEGDSLQLANAYLEAGHCYEKMGKNQEALESYKYFIKIAQPSQKTYAVLKKISDLEK